MQAPALRPAGKPGRETGSGRDLHDTALPQAHRAHGPPSENSKRPARAVTSRAARTRCLPMATITKLAKKIERVSALNGWRMRWHMQ
jgi:hypothetical protein